MFHDIVSGLYLDKVLEMNDPTHRPLHRMVKEELTKPLGMCYIGEGRTDKTSRYVLYW